MKNPNYKKENILRKYFKKTMRKNQFLEFIDSKDRKIKR